MTRTTYYGANVRIERRGMGLDGSLVVQRANHVGGGWIDDRTFYESASYCYTEAKSYAGALAAKIWATPTQCKATT
jgi:hypothetical protein